MATPAQIQANRLNAMRSSGPRSNEGKAASRFTALKHGIDAKSLTIPGEDPAELEALNHDYQRQFRPVGPLENFHVETIVKADWDRRRYTRIETQVLCVQLAAVAPPVLPAVGLDLGSVFLADALKANALQKLFRRQQAAERSYYRALAELRRAQCERLSEEAGDDAPPTDPIAAAIARLPQKTLLESMPIGFDLQNYWRKGGPLAIPVVPSRSPLPK
jgi:hypothetical protein